MNIRLAKEYDLEKIKELHNKFFKDQFEFPDFGKFFNTFIVEDNKKEIITFGGNKLIAEAIAITNLDYNIEDRYEALEKLLSALSLQVAEKGYDQLHCFVQGNESWLRRLKKHGFKSTKGNALVLEL